MSSRALGAGTWLAAAFLLSLAAAALWPVQPPAWLAAYFTPQQLQRAAALGRDGTLSFAAGGAIELAVLWWLARRALAGPARPFRMRDVIGWAVAALLAIDLASWPLDYLLGFRLAHAYGLSTATFGQWLGDWGKSAAIGLAVTSAACAGGYLVVRRSPRRWWLGVGGLLAALVVASTLLGPVLIDPLFYRFTPLPQGPLRSGIERLAAAAGAHLTGIYVMNASSRTTALNAYVNGLGGTARVVLYDTLLAKADQQQVLLVVAHELGHWKLHHVAWGTAMGAGSMWLTTGLLALLLAGLRRRGAISEAADPRGLPAVLLALALLSLLTLPVQNAVSRHMEAQADAFGLALTGDRPGFARMQAHLAALGLVNPDPPAWIEWTLYTHPSPLHRIEAALGGAPAAPALGDGDARDRAN